MTTISSLEYRLVAVIERELAANPEMDRAKTFKDAGCLLVKMSMPNMDDYEIILGIGRRLIEIAEEERVKRKEGAKNEG